MSYSRLIGTLLVMAGVDTWLMPRPAEDPALTFVYLAAVFAIMGSIDYLWMRLTTRYKVSVVRR